MKKTLVKFGLLSILIVFPNSLSAETYDLFDLTEGLPEETTEETTDNSAVTAEPITEPTEETPVEIIEEPTTNTNNTTEPTEAELTMAECFIYQQLEIEDKRCDEVMRSLSCPDYAGCLQACDIYITQCYSDITGIFEKKTYSQCVGEKMTCFDGCSRDYPTCSAKFPPTVNDVRAVPLALAAATGDVRVTYEDDPRAVDMETVKSDRNIHPGAAIFTGDNGSVILTLPNGVEQWVGPNSYFRIADYYASGTTTNTVTMLKNGDLEVKLEHPETQKVGYTVITPLGRVRATGTVFHLWVRADGTMELETTEGEVEILNTVGTLIGVVPAGQRMLQQTSGAMTFYADGQEISTWRPVGENETSSVIGWVIFAVLGAGGLLFVVIVGILVFAVRRKKSS